MRDIIAAGFGLALIAITAVPASAQQRITWGGRLGGDYGGDKVLTFEYADGSTPEVTAGGGVLFSLSGDVRLARPANHVLDARLGAGVKYRTIPPATNQEATWLRFPVELLAVYRAPNGFGLAGGPVMHMRNVFELSGEAANGRVEFESTPGWVAQAEYHMGAIAFDLRYTSMKYTMAGATGSLNASSFGGGFSYYFGRQRAVKVGG
jgi:hypothetical protein